MIIVGTLELIPAVTGVANLIFSNELIKEKNPDHASLFSGIQIKEGAKLLKCPH
jgi:hypothetical protein